MLSKAGTFFFAVLLLCGSAESAYATTLYVDAFPRLFLNQFAGDLRSNLALSESDPVTQFNGTSVEFSDADLGATELTVTSITTWSVASVLGEALGNEFTSVSLYFRPRGGTWQIATNANGDPQTGSPDTFFSDPDVVRNSNPDILHTNVAYRPDVTAYESLTTEGVFFPVWQNTFSNLELQLQTGVVYEFAVWGTNPDASPDTLYGYWFNHFSNPFLSGVHHDRLFGQYLRCDATNLDAPCFEADTRRDQIWDKRVNMNIQIEGFAGVQDEVPEPSSLILMTTAALSGMVIRFRKSRSVVTKRG